MTLALERHGAAHGGPQAERRGPFASMWSVGRSTISSPSGRIALPAMS